MTAHHSTTERTSLRKLDRTTRLRLARAESEGRVYDIPVRKVIVKSPKRILRELQSVKMRQTLPCESSIEYDWVTVLDVSPDVASFRVQPARLHYLDVDGKPRFTVPDLLVEFVDGRREFQEVKPDTDADSGKVRARTAALASICAARGEAYRVVRESEARSEPRLSNARELRRHRRHTPSAVFRASVTGLLRERPSMRLAALAEALGLGTGSVDDILAMVLHGMLSMDWETVPIGGGSLVRT